MCVCECACRCVVVVVFAREYICVQVRMRARALASSYTRILYVYYPSDTFAQRFVLAFDAAMRVLLLIA